MQFQIKRTEKQVTRDMFDSLLQDEAEDLKRMLQARNRTYKSLYIEYENKLIKAGICKVKRTGDDYKGFYNLCTNQKSYSIRKRLALFEFLLNNWCDYHNWQQAMTIIDRKRKKDRMAIMKIWLDIDSGKIEPTAEINKKALIAKIMSESNFNDFEMT